MMADLTSALYLLMLLFISSPVIRSKNIFWVFRFSISKTTLMKINVWTVARDNSCGHCTQL